MPKSRSEVKKIFAHELSFIKDQNIKEYAEVVLALCPSYFYSSPGSTGGKYHPVYENCKGGLILHTRTVVWLVHEMSELDMFELTQKQKDLMIVAALLHDCKRNGDNTRCRYSQFNHPICAYDFIMEIDGLDIISHEDVEFIADAVKSHMGQWNKKGKTELPLPKTKAQQLLHLADFIASRRELNVLDYLTETDAKVNDNNDHSNMNNINNFRLRFGKYSGDTIGEILEKDSQYVKWLYMKNTDLLKNGEKAFIPTEQLMLIGRLLENA